MPRLPKPRKRGLLRTLLGWIVALVATFYALAVLSLIAFRWVNPFTTMVQTERRIEAAIAGKEYHKQYEFVPLSSISLNLQHAVLSAEDGRFYKHHGIDWVEVQHIVDKDLEDGRLGRGGSTITQQLVKNLFFTTHRLMLRKVIEFTLAPIAELLLPKQRILELYLNVVEWGPGIYGAEAASQHWYHTAAARLGREQGARLAALLPSPLRRKPNRVNGYSSEISRRMAQTGW